MYLGKVMDDIAKNCRTKPHKFGLNGKNDSFLKIVNIFNPTF